MRLSSSDGACVALRPTGYQFGRGSLPRGDWDANWLWVHGEVRTSTGASWSFDDPCLTTWDAVELLAWLRAAGQGKVPPTDAPIEDSEGLLAFTEPNLGFSLATIENHNLVLRVHLSLESAPSWPETESDADRDIYAYSVSLSMSRTDLLHAAEEWQADIASFPER
ncbi:hypothetical protein [Pengzhenrongella phosphoraccumulans]|jgi:hypothetical protein|uniref:WapI family immunity protein n=1 Tax=Pengzhenrongella phosphoraccumulans TaxID=3114394 RepID=UPI003890B707